MAGKTTDTRQRLLAAARTEFLNCGYKGASLRRIAATVGIAAPSVYNHFAGKADMFSALVEPVIETVKRTFHAVDVDKRALAASKDGEGLLNRDVVMGKVLDFVYDNRDDVRLLLFCADGTRYDHILDRAAEMEAASTLQVLAAANHPAFSDAERETIVLLMRHQYRMYAEALCLGYDKARTAECWRSVSDFCTEGWKRILRLKHEGEA